MTTYERRKAQGLCVTCGKAPPRPGRVTCEACAVKQVAQNKAQRDKRKAEGRRVNTDPERVRERYASLKAQGLCTQCGKNPARPGKTRCAECAAKSRDANLRSARRWIAKCKARGVCIICGKTPVDGIQTCPVCTAKRNARSRELGRERYRARKAQGLCWLCGKPARPGKVACVECAKRQSERYAKLRGEKG